jgi:hypothetical protein
LACSGRFNEGVYRLCISVPSACGQRTKRTVQKMCRLNLSFLQRKKIRRLIRISQVCASKSSQGPRTKSTRNLSESTRVFADVNAENFFWRRDGCVPRDKEGSRKDEAWMAPCSRNVLDLVKRNAVVGKLRRKEAPPGLI